MTADDADLDRAAHEAAGRLLLRWEEITGETPPDQATLAARIVGCMRDTAAATERLAALSERDRELIETLRGVVRRTNQLLTRLAEVEMGELAFADNLMALTRLYWDTAEEMSGRAAALFATHPWSSLALSGPPGTPDSE
ncbi:MAG TPA: hypothetical protein VGL02_16930 [Streptomyces sp.]